MEPNPNRTMPWSGRRLLSTRLLTRAQCAVAPIRDVRDSTIGIRGRLKSRYMASNAPPNTTANAARTCWQSSPTGPVNKSSSKAGAAILLDHALGRYGPRQRKRAPLLQRSVATTVEQFWPAEDAKPIAIDPGASPIEALYDKMEELSPQSEVQRVAEPGRDDGARCGPYARAAV